MSDTKKQFSVIENYKSIFDNITDVIYRSDSRGNIIDISPSINNYYGYKRDEVIGKPIPDFYYYPKEREKLLMELQLKGRVNDFEIRLKNKENRPVYVSVTAYQLKNEKGEAVGVEGILRDISGRKEAERKLKEAYGFYDQILSTTTEGIYVCNRNMEYIYWNRQMEKISGFKKEQVLGKRPDELFPHVKKNKLEEYFSKALDGRRVTSDDYYFEVPETGRDGWSQAQYVPMKDDEGEITGVLVTIVDITDRKKAEESLKKSDETLKKLSDQVPGIIYQFQQFPDGRMNMPFISSGSSKIFEFSPEDMEKNASRAFERIHSEDLEKVMAATAKSIEMMKDWSVDFRVILPKKGVRWLRGQARPEKQPDGSMLWNGHITDITEIKEKEAELRNTIALINDQNNRLLNFAHIVSHNLRNHAGNISSLLSLYEIEETEKDRKELMEYLVLASNRLNESIIDLNEIVDSQSRVDQSMEKLSVSEKFEKVKQILSSDIKLYNVTIHESIPDDLEIVYNSAYLESIFLNLVSNAIKYRHPDRKPVVKVNVTENDGCCLLTIEDNGLGVDLKKYGDQLFGMYKTFHDNTNSKGIGLYITKNQVESLGGRIEVESKPGKGTRFYVTLKENGAL